MTLQFFNTLNYTMVGQQAFTVGKVHKLHPFQFYAPKSRCYQSLRLLPKLAFHSRLHPFAPLGYSQFLPLKCCTGGRVFKSGSVVFCFYLLETNKNTNLYLPIIEKNLKQKQCLFRLHLHRQVKQRIIICNSKSTRQISINFTWDHMTSKTFRLEKVLS